MGLNVHSIGELPREEYRSYYVYLLDYGWDETFGEAVRSNPPRMADAASRSDAVVIHGHRGMHFEDEVLSWHDIDGSPADEILPAIRVTTRHPRTFREVFGPSARFRAPADGLLLIPIRKTCKTPDDVVTWIDRLFRDMAGKKELCDFAWPRKCAGTPAPRSWRPSSSNQKWAESESILPSSGGFSREADIDDLHFAVGTGGKQGEVYIAANYRKCRPEL